MAKLGMLVLGLSFGSWAANADVYQAHTWLFSPHVGVSPSKFVGPFAINAVITDNPVLPEPVVVVPDAVVPLPSDDETPLFVPTNFGLVTIKNDQKANYRKLYKTPMTYGLDIGYFVFDNTEFFFGYQFLRAEGKSYVLLDQKLNGTHYVLRGKLKGYDAHLGYVGARRYFDVDPCFTPFVGLKLGGTQNKQGSANLILDNGVKINGVNKFNVPAYFNTIGFVGGPQVGVDYRILPNLSFYLSAEALFKTSHYADSRPAVFTNGGVNSVKMCTQVTKFSTKSWSFPMTLGFRIKR